MLPGSSTKLRLAVMVSRGDGPDLVGFHRFKKTKERICCYLPSKLVNHQSQLLINH